MSAITSEELLEQPAAADVNEDNYGTQDPAGGEHDQLSPLSMPETLDHHDDEDPGP